MSMDVKDYQEITGIINTAMATLKTDFEKDIQNGFDMLNRTLESQIKSRVSDTACEVHRKDISNERLEMVKQITVLETTINIMKWILGFLAPVALIGIVYGIMMFQQVQDLKEDKPPIVIEK